MDTKKLQEVLMESSIGFAHLELITDVQNRNRDFRFLDSNPALEKITGLKKEKITGKMVRELFPPNEAGCSGWTSLCDRIALAGGSSEFEHYFESSGRWYQVHVHFTDKPFITLLFVDITGQKKSEVLLQINEKDLRESQRISQMGSWRLDINTNQFTWTEELYKMYGFDPSLPPPPYTEHMKLFTAESWGRLSKALANTRETGIPYTLELETVRKDGSNGWMWVHGEADVDQAGKILSLWGAAQNITEPKQAEEELRISQERLLLATSGTGIGIWDWDIVNDDLFFDDSMMRLYGIERNDFTNVYEAWSSRLHPDDKQHTEGEIQAALNGEREYVTEFRIVLPDGSVRFISASSRTLRNEQGKPVRMLGINTDITEQKRAEGALRRSHLCVELTLKGGNLGTWDWNIQTGETVFNERWAEMLGYTLEELSPTSIQTWFDLCHQDDLKVSNELLHNHFAGTTEFYECQARVKHKNGSWVWVNDHGRVSEWDSAGKPLRMFGIHTDITFQKREESVNLSRLNIMALSIGNTNTDTIMSSVLDAATFLTESSIGFFHFVDDDQNTINLQAWSSNTLKNLCTAEGKGWHYPVREAGVWADAIRKGEPVVYNDFAGVPNRRGLPEGHAAVNRMITVPIMRNSKVVAAIGVGNKLIDYNDQDVSIVKRLAEEAFDVIMRKRAEEALKESVVLLKRSQQIAHLGSWILDVPANRLDWSDEVYRIFGCEPQEFGATYEAFLSFVHPDDRDMVNDAYTSSLQEKRDRYEIEHRIVRKATGEVRFVHERCIHEFDAAGAVICSTGMVQDITERKKAEEALRLSEEQFRNAFEYSAIGIALFSPEGRWLKVNSSLCTMFGYQEDELLSKTFQDITHPEDLDADLAFVQQMLAGSIRTYQMEKRYYGKDGRIIWALLSVSLVRDQDGAPLHFIKQIQDITDRKVAETDVRESEKKFRMLFETMAQGVVYQDFSGRIVSANRAAEEILGLTLDQLQGRTSIDPRWQSIREDGTVFPGEEHPAMISLKTGKVSSAVMGVHNPAIAQDRWINIVAIPEFRDGESSPFQVFTTFDDITELKITLDDLNKSKVLLEVKVEERTKQILEVSGLQKAILKNAPLAILTTDLEGIMQSINPAGEKMLGYTANEIIGKQNPLFFHDMPEMIEFCRKITGNSHPSEEEIYQTALQNMFQSTTEWTWVRKNGEKFPVRITHSTITDDNGTLLGYMGLIIDISEERKAITTLLESEERFHNMFYDHASIMLLIHPESGEIIEANKSAEQFYGIAFNTGTKRNISEINALPEQAINAEISNAINNRQNVFFFPHKLQSGEIRTVEVHSTPIVYGGKKILFSIIHDITDRMVAESALKKSEAENRAIIQAVPDLMFRISRDGTYLDAHYQNDSSLYVSKEAFIGKKITEILPPDLAEQSMNSIEKAFATGKTEQYDYSLTIHGNDRYFENRMIAISADKVLSIIRDITDRKESEAALQMQSAAFESFSLAIIITDINGAIKWANSAFANLTGYSLEEAIGKTPGQLVRSGKQDKIFYENLWNTILGKKVWTGQMINRKKDGTLYYEEQAITPVLNPQGEIANFISIKIDITDRKKTQEALLKAKEEAEKANKAKSMFLSRMSHELRTPMNSILGFAQLLEMGELNQKQKKGVTHILNNGKHLLDLINEVLDISGIEAGKQTLLKEPIALSLLINEVIDSLQSLADKKKVSIIFEGSSSEKVSVLADRVRLRQILINLIENAIKYNVEGGAVTIRTLVDAGNDKFNRHVKIEVSDTGIGVKAEDISKLFLPFERIGAEKTDTEGTGLGLMVVKRLTEAMGGTVEVESTLGKGSTFWVELPAGQESNQASVKNIESKHPEIEHNEYTSAILYVEDNLSNIELVNDILSEHRPGISLFTTSLGVEATDLAKIHQPALILLDLDLPDIQGIEVLEQLLNNVSTKSIPVIVVSADAMPQQIEKLIQAGAKEYLTKPLDIVMFLQVIDIYTNAKLF